MHFSIRAATADDIPQLLDLHNWAIANLEGIWIEQTETLEGRTAWFDQRMADGFPVLVAHGEDGKIVGYGSYGTFRGRDGYDLTVEHSVYLYPQAHGHGLGKKFMELLIEDARAKGKHMMVGIIDAQNQVSIKLHEKFGFIYAGTLPQAGKKRGEWRDQTSYYLLLDDRAKP